MRLKIQEFYTLTSSDSTVGGGVGFWRGCFFLLVVVAFFCGRYAQNRRPNSSRACPKLHNRIQGIGYLYSKGYVS